MPLVEIRRLIPTLTALRCTTQTLTPGGKISDVEAD